MGQRGTRLCQLQVPQQSARICALRERGMASSENAADDPCSSQLETSQLAAQRSTVDVRFASTPATQLFGKPGDYGYPQTLGAVYAPQPTSVADCSWSGSKCLSGLPSPCQGISPDSSTTAPGYIPEAKVWTDRPLGRGIHLDYTARLASS
jgi:hypothetical protein